MLTVRFPSGVAVQYNAATHFTFQCNGTVARLLDRGEHWIADVALGGGAIIEAVAPCAVRVAGPTTVEQAARFLVDHESELRAMGWPEAGALVELKTILAEFHRQRRTWTR